MDDDPFADMDLDGVWKQTLVERRANYEDVAVKHLLTKLGLGSGIRAYVRELAEKSGRRKPLLTFAWYHEIFQDFPVQMGVARLWHLSDLDLPDLLKRFTKLKFFEAFEALREELDLPRKAPLAMFFDYPRLSKFACLHTAAVDMDLKRTMFVRPVRDEVFVLEKMDSFLASIVGQPYDEDEESE